MCCISASCMAAGAGTKHGVTASPLAPEPTQAGVVGWAKVYSDKYEPKLTGNDKELIDSIKAAFYKNKNVKYFMDDTISKLVTELTLSLAAKKKFEPLICATTMLVNTDPKNARVINLFAAMLSYAGKSIEVLPILQYGISVRPKNPLLRLNLANAYMDANQDAKAKAILDKLAFENPNDKAVWRALATYWYKKNDMTQFRTCLLRAASFKGFAQQKQDKKKKKVDDNAAVGSESATQLEPKIKELATSLPFTSADVLEEDYPEVANQIKDKYCKLQGDEKWRLPKLPVCNTATPKEYAESRPILDEWANVFTQKYTDWCNQKAIAMGVDPNASDSVVSAQAEAAANKKVEEALKNAQEMLKNLKNIPGMDTVDNRKELNDALKEIQKAAKDQGIKVPKVTPMGSGDDSGNQDESTVMSKNPMFDSGSPWAQINYRNYSEVQRTYAVYFSKYYKEFNAKVQDIYNVYAPKAKLENKRYEEEVKQLDAINAGGLALRRAELKHKQLMNALALDFYNQWTNLYMPQYAQKMKPNLDAYWDVCMIYIHSMTDPKIMQREFEMVKTTYLMFAGMAGTAIGGGGGFEYYPETDEEQRQLDIDIAIASAEAKKRQPQFERDFESPGFDVNKWIADHFVVDIAAEFFALKVTSRSIQFEASAECFKGTIKWSPIDNIIETSSSVGYMHNIGINIFGIGGKLEAGPEIKRTATWDLDNNTYKETDSAAINGKASLADVKLKGSVELDAQMNATISGKITAGDFTAQDKVKIPLK